MGAIPLDDQSESREDAWGTAASYLGPPSFIQHLPEFVKLILASLIAMLVIHAFFALLRPRSNNVSNVGPEASPKISAQDSKTQNKAPSEGNSAHQSHPSTRLLLQQANARLASKSQEEQEKHAAEKSNPEDGEGENMRSSAYKSYASTRLLLQRAYAKLSLKWQGNQDKHAIEEAEVEQDIGIAADDTLGCAQNESPSKRKSMQSSVNQSHPSTRLLLERATARLSLKSQAEQEKYNIQETEEEEDVGIASDDTSGSAQNETPGKRKGMQSSAHQSHPSTRLLLERANMRLSLRSPGEHGKHANKGSEVEEDVVIIGA